MLGVSLGDVAGAAALPVSSPSRESQPLGCSKAGNGSTKIPGSPKNLCLEKGKMFPKSAVL